MCFENMMVKMFIKSNSFEISCPSCSTPLPCTRLCSIGRLFICVQCTLYIVCPSIDLSKSIAMWLQNYMRTLNAMALLAQCSQAEKAIESKLSNLGRCADAGCMQITIFNFQNPIEFELGCYACVCEQSKKNV